MCLFSSLFLFSSPPPAPSSDLVCLLPLWYVLEVLYQVATLAVRWYLLYDYGFEWMDFCCAARMGMGE